MDGGRLPVSIAHFYNSCNSDADEFGLGYGWRTSVHQTLHKEYINSKIAYVYTDGDGTEHWFEQSGGQYGDLSGLSMKLAVADDGRITITGKDDSRMVYPKITAVPTASAPITGKVLVETMYDAVGNKITVTPRADKPLYISSVQDGAGRTTAFVYAAQSDGVLRCTAIKTPWQTDATCTRFSYAGGCLTLITHEDQRTSSYHYEIRNGYRLLDQAQGADGLAVRYKYSNTGAVYGLPHYVTYAETGETAILSPTASIRNAALFSGKVNYHYGNHLTRVTDEISQKTLRYHFNDNGNQISVDDELGHAVYTAYDQRGDNANTPVNHVTTRSRMQRAVKNLLQDPMIEEGSSVWKLSGTGSFIRHEGTNQWGLVSYRGNVPAGSEAYVRQTVSLTPGKPYTLSAYMKSGGPKAFVRVAYTIGGATKYINSDAVPVDANAASAPFRRVAVSFTLPASASAAVHCDAIGMTTAGYFWFDCMQLEEGLTCNHFNLLQNTDFTRQAPGASLPASWALGNDNSGFVSIRDLSVADDVDGKLAPAFLRSSRAARLAGSYYRTVTLKQELRYYGSAGDRFTAGGWCKSFAKRVDEDSYIYCSLSVYFTGGNSWSFGGRVNFNYGEDGWQFASGGIVAPYNFTKIRFVLHMNRQMNHADFTGLYLYPEAFGTDYVYDAKGNQKKAIQLFGGKRQTEYDDYNNSIRTIAPGHTQSTTFTYGGNAAEQKKHLLRGSLSPLGTAGQWGYDGFGNALRADVTGKVNGSSAISRTTAEFQHNGNYLYKRKDARGMTVTSAVDANKGTVSTVTDAKGQAASYAYDALRRLVNAASSAGGREFRSEYAYDSARGLLSSVKHNTDATAANDVSYHFSYDALGRKTTVKVGSATLSTNVYQNNLALPHYGTLAETRYGNGAVVKKEYDDFDRVTGVKFGTESLSRYQYAYNANGQTAHVRDNQLGRITESEYDLSNRPCRVKTFKFTEDAAGNCVTREHVYTGEAAYDAAFGRLTTFSERVGAAYAPYATAFGYDNENRPASLNYGAYGASTVEYDGLGRIAKTTVKAGGGTANTASYTYAAGAALETAAPSGSNTERVEAAANAAGKASTSGLVQAITQTGGSFEYAYDANGNITTVKQDGVTTTYTYDALGQLTRVDDGLENATWLYTYDQGGNILTKKKFARGVTSGTPAETKTFSYANANWRDQLTAVNGAAITYDAIGNPLNDGVWAYTWQNGRQLQKMQKSGETVSFAYNENGLRVQKTASSTGVTQYILHGKNIVHLTQGGNSLHFFYDAQNRPAVVVYNGTAYGYVKNLQGDVVAILDNARNKVVEYKYDAWGRPLAKTGSLAASLGKLNPFRYRGYAFDEETGLYYLRSRYYNPIWGRFVNADIIMEGNLFAYCKNNPVVNADNSGFLTVCCFDENGHINTLMSVLMAGGAGGCGGAFGGYAVIDTVCNMDKDDWINEAKTVIKIGLFLKLSGLIMAGAHFLGSAFLAEAAHGVGKTVGYFLYGATVANGLGISYLLEEGIRYIFGEENAPPTKEEFAIDFSLEFSPIKIPTAIDFLITYLKDAIDWEALQAVLEK